MSRDVASASDFAQTKSSDDETTLFEAAENSTSDISTAVTGDTLPAKPFPMRFPVDWNQADYRNHMMGVFRVVLDAKSDEENVEEDDGWEDVSREVQSQGIPIDEDAAPKAAEGLLSRGLKAATSTICTGVNKTTATLNNLSYSQLRLRRIKKRVDKATRQREYKALTPANLLEPRAKGESSGSSNPMKKDNRA